MILAQPFCTISLSLSFNDHILIVSHPTQSIIGRCAFCCCCCWLSLKHISQWLNGWLAGETGDDSHHSICSESHTNDRNVTNVSIWNFVLSLCFVVALPKEYKEETAEIKIVPKRRGLFSCLHFIVIDDDDEVFQRLVQHTHTHTHNAVLVF